MSISIYPTNLGRYNEGYLVGDWIELPMKHDELWQTINKVCKVDPFHEEIFISDYETDSGIDLLLSEYESIDEVNALAAAIDQLDPWELDAVVAFNDYDSLDTMELANVCMDAENIPYFQYSVSSDFMSNEEKLGYTFMELNPELQKVLDDHNLEDYFDYERYGRDMAMDCHLMDEGYIDCAMKGGPDTDSYNAQELLEELGYWDADEDEDDFAA